MGYSTIEGITNEAVARWSTTHDTRVRELITKLIPHVHAWDREVKLTHSEWLAGLNFLARVGQCTTAARGEHILLSDVIGLSMLTVMINDDLPKGATPSTVVGPFHMGGSPEKAAGESMA